MVVRNPFIDNPQGAIGATLAQGAGIRVDGGTGFRCHGGFVRSSDDGALQFAPAVGASDGVSDGAFIGTRCETESGRLMAAATASNAIRNVRFLGITGTSTGGGECIGVRNLIKEGRANATISDVFFRDVTVTQTAREVSS